MLGINPLSKVSLMNIYHPAFSRFSFHFVNGLLCCQNLLLFNVVPFVYFLFPLTEDICQKKILLREMLESLLPMFTSRSFMVLGLTFKHLIYFGFILIYGVRRWYKFLFACICPFSQHLPPPHFMFLHILSYIN